LPEADATLAGRHTQADGPEAKAALSGTPGQGDRSEAEGLRRGVANGPDLRASNAMRLLIVEDNLRLAEWLGTLLRRENFVVDCLPDGESLVEGVDLDNHDLAIVDLGLPGIGGIEVVRHIRQRRPSMPVLILTAEDGLRSRVAGLDAGADDYLTKPFEIEELEARLRALLRRAGSLLRQELTFGPVTYDQTSRQFSLAGEVLPLSPREHVMLETLMRRAGHTVSKEALLESSYSFDEAVQPSAIEVIVFRLRRKLEGTGVGIATLRGLGYMLRLEKR
jgi:two-component system, OmpR family, response regulator TctD